MSDLAEDFERVDKLPSPCPGCGRKNVDEQWVHYRLIPGAPAAGCGNCGHVIYVTDTRFGTLRRAARDAHPKAADGTAKFKFKRRKK